MANSVIMDAAGQLSHMQQEGDMPIVPWKKMRGYDSFTLGSSHTHIINMVPPISHPCPATAMPAMPGDDGHEPELSGFARMVGNGVGVPIGLWRLSDAFFCMTRDHQISPNMMI